ncbi:MAG: DNA-directed RNA polymerase subunit alpha [Patescibacteria group bacterium]
MQIILPQKPNVVQKNNFEAVIEIESLYPGYGMTVGNALRRVMLSSLPGAAVTYVKIKNASHEFSTLPGVLEDIVEILLNIKRIRFQMHSDEPQRISVNVRGERKVTAADIEAPSQISVVNTDAHIATLTDKKAVFDVEMTVEKGFGYVPVEDRKKEKLEIGTIAVDAIFTPIRKVNYEVENMRVGDRTDFDKIRFVIETDGTIDPEDAFTQAARILVDHFNIVTGMERMQEEAGAAESAEEETDATKTKIADLAIPARVARALEEANIKTVASLVKKTEADILALEGMGEKGVSEIKKALKKLKLSFKEEK